MYHGAGRGGIPTTASTGASALNNQSVVLVADDDPSILKLVRLELSEQGFRVLTAETGEHALQIIDEQHPDLLVLDVILPGISGLEVMRRVQQKTTVPIVLLTARNTDRDKVRGLEMGADDYLAKPFNPEELTARVRAVLRRARRPAGATNSVLKVRDLEIDAERRVVSRDGEIIRLTRTEWNLLQSLVEHAGKVMLTGEILSKVWGPEYRDDVQYLRVWVSRLRQKLEPDRPEESLIKTFPGMGYMLEAPAEEEEEPAEDTASA